MSALDDDIGAVFEKHCGSRHCPSLLLNFVEGLVLVSLLEPFIKIIEIHI